MKRNGKSTGRNRKNLLRQGAVVTMSILLALPAMPARAAEAGKGMAMVSIVPEMDSGVDAVVGSVVSEILTEDGRINAQSVIDAEIGEVSPELSSEGDNMNGVYDIHDTHDSMEESVSDGNAVKYGISIGETRAAASTGTVGQPDENGNVLEWSYDGSTKTLTITGIGRLDGFNGNSLKTELFENMEIKKVQFQNCKVIGSMVGAFASLDSEDYNISKVEQIDFAGLDTSSVTSMSLMFYGCSNLKSLDLSNWDTRNVDGMLGMFHGCSKLENLNLSNWNTSNVVSMGGCFMAVAA